MARLTSVDLIRRVCDFLPFEARPEAVCTRWREAVYGRRLCYRCAPRGLMPRLLMHMLQYAGSAGYLGVTLDGNDEDSALTAAGVLSYIPLRNAQHVRLAVASGWRRQPFVQTVDTLLRILTAAPHVEHIELDLLYNTLGARAWRRLNTLIRHGTQWPQLCALSLTACPTDSGERTELTHLIGTAIEHLRSVTIGVQLAELIPGLTSNQTGVDSGDARLAITSWFVGCIHHDVNGSIWC